MARTVPARFVYHIEFQCAIRGHHAYKNWTPTMREKLICKKDDREEALSYDDHAIGVYKNGSELVGHISIEVSALLHYFLQNSKENMIFAVGAGKRKREMGLVVPARYVAETKDKRTAQILSEELLKKKEKYSHLEFDLMKIDTLKKNLIKTYIAFFTIINCNLVKSLNKPFKPSM